MEENKKKNERTLLFSEFTDQNIALADILAGFFRKTLESIAKSYKSECLETRKCAPKSTRFARCDFLWL
ncbi:hypothetical protein DLM75_17675 [Leptospira stimsonii]|uniref:Uncharacterized protein n=1 Tax=Leptospira stimsonii TaxID=2202203 RepID=A0A396Z1C5_9LEPT|nr:hypothetical protein DLM75_17675 [Leptospira stimsonii]